MKDIKELALRVAKEMYWMQAPHQPDIIDFATRLIAAYCEGQEPVARSLPEKWELGMRVRFLSHKEWAWNAGTEATVVELSNDCKDRRGDEYQVFWTEPDGGGAIWWTTPDDVELLTPNVSSTAPPEPAPQQQKPQTTIGDSADPAQPAAVCAAPSSDEVRGMVERLRRFSFPDKEAAADLIERLAAERDMWREADLRDASRVDELAAEVKRLAARVPDGCVVVQRKVTENVKCVLATPGNYRTYQDQWDALIAAGEASNGP